MISRAQFLAGGLALISEAALAPGTPAPTSQDGSGAGSGAKRLRLQPPKLSNPNRLVLTQSFVEAHRSIDLRGPGQDWIVEFPKDTYLDGAVVISGQGEARHIVVIGGGVRPTRRYDPKTMRLTSTGDYAVYAQRGFTGATGGSFRFTVMEKSYIYAAPPVTTATLPWNAKPAEIKAALEAVAGPGSVFAVDGPDTPGGPWKIVPSHGPLLGRPVLDISGLTGASKAQTTQVNVFDAAPGACVAFRQWTGTVHCEGVHVGGDYALDGFQCQNSIGDAVLQMANCHSEPGFHVFHDDWVHPDGAQFYLGPTTARLERVDFISAGGNGFISQPREAGGLELWRDWWLRDCHFRAIQDDTNGRAADASTSCFREDDYPAQSQNLSGQLWDVDGVFCSRGRRSDGAELTNDAETKYYYHAGVTRPAGIVIRERPPAGNFCDPEQGDCGPGYVSPGYDGTVVPLLTKRPQA